MAKQIETKSRYWVLYYAAPRFLQISGYASSPTKPVGNMAAIAEQMGAIHKLDLTSDVTHLIVGNVNTPKYQYVAKDRQDIKVLRPEWVAALRTSWMEGGETDVAALEEEHKLPAFAGLQICVTGFDDLQQRNYISETVEANGAHYHSDLTKAVTHLIAAAPRGKKFEYAGQWGIKTVALEWLKDSLQRGMVLDESLYHPLKPAEERGIGAINSKGESSSSLGKRFRDQDPSEPVEPGRRKLRRTTSSKLESQNDDLWADIGAGDASVRPQSVASKTDDRATLQGQQSASSTRHYPTPKSDDPRPESGAQQAEAGTRGNAVQSVGEGGVFHGVNFCLHGFDMRKTNILCKFISSSGGKIWREEEARNRLDSRSEAEAFHLMVVIPHDTTASPLPSDCPIEEDRIVTDLWIEKCLHRKAIVDTNAALCRPFLKPAIQEFTSLTICPTSFSGIDLLHFSKTVKLFGARYDECLRPETSVLVCNDGHNVPNPEKLKYALEHDIPVVRAQWMWSCITEGVLRSFDDYQLIGDPHRKGTSIERAGSKRGHPPSKCGDSSNGLSHSTCISNQDENHEESRPVKEANGKPSQSSKSTQDRHTGPLQDLPPEMNSQSERPHSQSFVDLSHSTPPEAPDPGNNARGNIGPASKPLSPSKPDAQKSPSKSASNSPTKRRTTTNPKSKTNSPTKQPSAPPPATKKQPSSLTQTLQSLLRNPKRTLPATSTSQDEQPASIPAAARNRRARPLGRAPSNPSSLYASGSRAESATLSTEASMEPVDEDDAGDGFEATRGQMGTGEAEQHGFRPSQALSWGNASGTTGTREGFRRVESIGTVKGAAQGVGGLGGGEEAGVGKRRARRR